MATVDEVGHLIHEMRQSGMSYADISERLVAEFGLQRGLSEKYSAILLRAWFVEASSVKRPIRGGSRDSWGRLVAWAKADCAEPKCNDGQMKFCWSSDPYRHIVSKIGLVGYLKCQGPLMFAIKCAQFDKTWHPTPENIGLSSNFCTLYLHTFDILRNLYFLVIRIKCSWTSSSPCFS